MIEQTKNIWEWHWRGIGTFVLLLLGVMVLHYGHFMLSYGGGGVLCLVCCVGAVVAALLPMRGLCSSSKALLSASLFLVLSEQQISVIGRSVAPSFR